MLKLQTIFHKFLKLSIMMLYSLTLFLAIGIVISIPIFCIYECTNSIQTNYTEKYFKYGYTVDADSIEKFQTKKLNVGLISYKQYHTKIVCNLKLNNGLCCEKEYDINKVMFAKSADSCYVSGKFTDIFENNYYPNEIYNATIVIHIK